MYNSRMVKNKYLDRIIWFEHTTYIKMYILRTKMWKVWGWSCTDLKILLVIEDHVDTNSSQVVINVKYYYGSNGIHKNI